MPVLRLPHTKLPGPARPDWIDFLRWMADVCTAHDIVDLVEKPHKFGDEYAEYLMVGGLER